MTALADRRPTTRLLRHSPVDPGASCRRRGGEVAGGQGSIGSTQANTTAAYTIQPGVESTFTAKTIGNTAVYDLTTGAQVRSFRP